LLLVTPVRHVNDNACDRRPPNIWVGRGRGGA
jgi:hypothetical protein